MPKLKVMQQIGSCHAAGKHFSMSAHRHVSVSVLVRSDAQVIIYA
jgi:hypothetical protein